MRLWVLCVLAGSGWLTAGVPDRADVPLSGKECTWWAQALFYDCNYKDMAAIPADIDATARTLALAHNRLAGTLQKNDWTPGCCGAVRILDLSNNALSTLKADAFDELPQLTSLDLSDNALTSLNPGGAAGLTALASLGELRSLSVRGNRISSIAEADFAGMPKLERLDLGGNRIAALPAAAFDRLGALQWLSLRGNALSAVPLGTFTKELALRTLDLYDNAIPHFDTRTWDALAHLEKLSVSRSNSSAVGVLARDLVSCDGRPGLSRAIHFGPYNPAATDRWFKMCEGEADGHTPCENHCVSPTAVVRNVCRDYCANGTSLDPQCSPCLVNTNGTHVGHRAKCSICCDAALDARGSEPCLPPWLDNATLRAHPRRVSHAHNASSWHDPSFVNG